MFHPASLSSDFQPVKISSTHHLLKDKDGIFINCHHADLNLTVNYRQTTWVLLFFLDYMAVISMIFTKLLPAVWFQVLGEWSCDCGMKSMIGNHAATSITVIIQSSCLTSSDTLCSQITNTQLPKTAISKSSSDTIISSATIWIWQQRGNCFINVAQGKKWNLGLIPFLKELINKGSLRRKQTYTCQEE